jgi:magnesium chelatase family protein
MIAGLAGQAPSTISIGSLFRYPVKECTCSYGSVIRHKKRISGPFIDRIDIFVEVPRVEYEKLVAPASAESSADVLGRTEMARATQRERLREVNILTNSDMRLVEVWDFCQTEDAAQGLLQQAMKQMNLSARGFHRILKVARTIADLAGSETIGVAHLAESPQYRPTGWG